MEAEDTKAGVTMAVAEAAVDTADVVAAEEADVVVAEEAAVVAGAMMIVGLLLLVGVEDAAAAAVVDTEAMTMAAVDTEAMTTEATGGNPDCANADLHQRVLIPVT